MHFISSSVLSARLRLGSLYLSLVFLGPITIATASVEEKGVFPLEQGESRAKPGAQIKADAVAAANHPLKELLGGKPGLPNKGPTQLPGEILVKLKKGSPSLKAFQQASSDKRRGIKAALPPDGLSELLTKYQVAEMKSVFRVAGQPAPAKKAAQAAASPSYNGKTREDLFRWYRLTIPTNSDPANAIAALKAFPEVETAEPNYLCRLAEGGIPDGTTNAGTGLQWHLDVVKAQRAWSFLQTNGWPAGGTRDVVVAVVDSGVDHTHEDLIGNMWVNPGEIPGNGIDDDENGFVDDVHGCSVVSDPRSHSGDSSDYAGHGTHVAGIIAATAFNQRGGVGVAFNVQLMAVRAAQYSGVLTATDVAEGLLYAVDNGADVINMSFGGYQRSQIEEDALGVALNQAALIAAAGNDSLSILQAPFYPAALPYVLGVEATQPPPTEHLLAWFSNHGYEVGAPGMSIYSTLPGNQYAQWSGTSMAAPIVSGLAALMRSLFWQRDVYSSRFIMGAIFGTKELGEEPGYQSSGLVDGFAALTKPPMPGVTYLQNWVFDNKGISPNNDGDGRVDAGETLNLGIELINRSGQADEVIGILEARAAGTVQNDPYVYIDVPLVDFGSIGPFNTSDNGFLYDAGGVITNAVWPFVFTVSPDCPNDHVISFILTLDFMDGWDPEHHWYQTNKVFNYVVQRGRDVPTVISTNTTLTADQYWLVGGPVLVESGASLRIEPGTQIQWGGLSDDPYNPGPQNGYIIVRGTLDAEGTWNDPILMFPSYLVSGQTVKITVEDGGSCGMQYVKIQNPWLTGVQTINHGYLYWDQYSTMLDIAAVSNTTFSKFRGGGTMTLGRCDCCLFDASWLAPEGGPIRNNCAFLQDNENNKPLALSAPLSFKNPMTCDQGDVPFWSSPQFTNGETYVVLPMEELSLRLAETIAHFYGGHVASVRDQAESDFLKAYLPAAAAFRSYGSGNHSWAYVGLSDNQLPGTYLWLDASPLDFTDWADGYPAGLNPSTEHVVQFMDVYNNGNTQVWGWRNVNQTPSIRFGNGSVGSWKHFVLRLPGDWTLDALNVAVTNGLLLAYVRENLEPCWKYNAFLNKFWDASLPNWMRVLGTPWVSSGYCTLHSNYWGSDNIQLIDHMILDYYDNFTSARIDYNPPATQGYETTYPFVESVLINGISAVSVPQLEGGLTTFTVTFNRDMNTNVEPFVTFGPTPPHTDFQVKPRDTNFIEVANGWINPRTWAGQAWITPVTGNGYHLMRISGAVAADDPWLVSGYDVGRFRFRVQTLGVASMALQANGGEGYVELLWQQNDYDLVAGYNLYGATNIDGPFTKLNATIIPPGQERYFDTNVVPAVPMFYQFTVVTTDFQESDPSNIASAAAFDTIPPVLLHTPVTVATPGRQLRLEATAQDNVRVASILLNYRAVGATAYSTLPMLNVASNNWSVTISASAVQPPGLEYYLVASDGQSQVLSGTPATPHSVIVNDQPTLSSVSPNHGPAQGGTAVTLSGLQFQPGASVLFGGVLASNIVLLSGNQINCVTPPHFPAAVEIQVVNTNGTQNTLLNGFFYETTDTVLSLPNTVGDFGATVEIALSAANLTGLRAADLTVLFDPAVLSAQSARVGALAPGWSLTANTLTPGRVMLSLANSTAVSGSGPLAHISFEVVGHPPASTALTITNVALNDGAMAVEVSPGLFTVNGFWNLAGSVRYYQGTGTVRNVQLQMVGVGAHATVTDTNGAFVLTNLPTGSYTLRPAKSDDVAGITAYDASLVLQSSAGLLALSTEQAIAADVNRNGTVSSMDAAYILENAVGLLDAPFPNAGRVWDFVPTDRSYSLLNSDLPDQDFVAVLLGDVSGNWSPSQVPTQGEADRGIKSDQFVTLALNTDLVRTNRSLTRVLFRADAPGVYSADLVLIFNSPISALRSVAKGASAQSALLVSNTNEPGVLRCAIAGASPLTGEGDLLVLDFQNSAASGLHLLRASVNEGGLSVEIATNALAFDRDADGLLDLDETSVYHTDPLKPDTDGDGLSDGQEVLAGTNPADASSLLRVIHTAVNPDQGATLTWSSVPGRKYQVEYRSTLSGAAWNSISGELEADDTATSFTDPAATNDTPSFYRVRLVYPQ